MERPSTRSPRFPAAGLVWTLVRTDFKTRYHATLGGFLWALLKPLLMFLVLMAVFSFVFQTEANYPINLIIGLFLWDFFLTATTVGLTSLYAKGFLVTRARFPTWIVVVASTSNALITLLVFACTITGYLALRGHGLSMGAVCLFGLYQLLYLLIVVGFSLASSVLFLRYRDLNQVWEVGTQAGFFLAPIIWPIGTVPERYHFYLYMWLPTAVIQFSRAVLVDGKIPTLRAHLMLVAATFTVLAIGVAVFKKSAPRAMERL